VSGLDELSREELIALVLKLHETVQEQQKQIAEMKATVERQAERISELEAEVARLRGGGSCAQVSVRPSVPRKEKQARKKRKHSFARRSLEATQVAYHAVERCPDCGRMLGGGHIKWRHQVASAMVGKKIRGMLPSQIKTDKVIKRQYDYLSHLQNIRQIDDGNYYNSILRYPINNTVTRWFDCQTGVLKHYLEALLLTDRESTEIAQDLNTDVEMVNEYEKLFFNINDPSSFLFANHKQ